MKIMHGDNQLASREAFFKLGEELRAKYEVVGLSNKEINLTAVKQVIESMGLFGADHFLVIERLFAGPASNTKKEVVEYLKKNKPVNVLIWEDKKVDGRKLSGFEAEEFKVSSRVFTLLESITPSNQREFIPLLNEVLRTEPVELVFFLLVRQTRQLIEAASGASKGPTWLVSKLKNQASRFGMDRLIAFHGDLYTLELETKTGRSPLPLDLRLELKLMQL